MNVKNVAAMRKQRGRNNMPKNSTMMVPSNSAVQHRLDMLNRMGQGMYDDKLSYNL